MPGTLAYCMHGLFSLSACGGPSTTIGLPQEQRHAKKRRITSVAEKQTWQEKMAEESGDRDWEEVRQGTHGGPDGEQGSSSHCHGAGRWLAWLAQAPLLPLVTFLTTHIVKRRFFKSPWAQVPL
jgi:hypothetical protein